MTGFIYSTQRPTAHEFAQLRNSAGWGDITLNTAKAVLNASLSFVTVYTKDGKLIGMARIVGDGILNVYIQDVIIAPEFRRQGMGRQIIQTLLKEMSAYAAPDCTIGLMAAYGQDSFYESLGFLSRPSNSSKARLGSAFTASRHTLANASLRA